MPSKYPKGSEWRKWDLHIHTPMSHLANEFHGNWDGYVEKIVASDLAVIGATNYYCFVENEIERIKDALDELGSDTQVFANAEFRIAHPNKEGEFIHIHAIFSDELGTQEINRSLAKVRLINTTGEGRAVYCEESSIDDAGLNYENILIDFEQLLSQLKEDFVCGKDFVIAAAPRGQGNFRPAAGDGRGNALAIEIDKNCHIMFGAQDDVEHFSDDQRYTDAASKPVLACSDAHQIEQIGEKFTWVKADPTFEGLKQTVYEPTERVRIQNDSPQLDYAKPFFNSIKARGKIMLSEGPAFRSVEIPLNPNLVTLIGGRGTGKSILLDCIYGAFKDASEIKDQRLSNIKPDEFTVSYNKVGGEKVEYLFDDHEPLSYLHVRQGDIRSFVSDPVELGKQIKQLLSIRVSEKPPYFDFDLSEVLLKIKKDGKWFSILDADGNYINTKNYNESKLRSNEALITTITTQQNKELIESYKTNTGKINEQTLLLEHLNELKTVIESNRNHINGIIININQLITSGVPLPSLDTSILDEGIIAITLAAESEIDELKTRNLAISEQFREQGIDQDVGGLLNKLDTYQGAIDLSKDKLTEIERKSESIKEAIAVRVGYAQKIAQELDQQKISVDDAFRALKNGRVHWRPDQKALVSRLLSDIKIEGQITFNSDLFYSNLQALLNGQKFRSTSDEPQLARIRKKLNVDSYESYLRLIGNEPVIIGENGELETLDEFASQKEYFLEADYDIFEFLYLHENRNKYLSINAIIEYKGKPPEKLSVGQRGTFYVCLKLATDPFGSPFIFDQPEDDLDNEFIMEELVPLFREIKKYRQVIIATHNANLVVNADAEQVIVAENVDEEIDYQSGALEYSDRSTQKGIREEVCRILEGGKPAFEKRERKYGFRNS